MPDAPGITVAICTLDRAESLVRTLASLRGEGKAGGFEVLIVDNGSRDDTAARADAQARDFPVPLRCVREECRGLSFARNRALADARGDVLLFTDDDVTVRPGWIAGYRRAFADARVAGAGGRVLPVLPDATPAWFRAALGGELGGPSARYDLGEGAREIEIGADAAAPPVGANMGVRRDAALGLGGFSTALGWGTGLPGEETDLFLRLLGAGGRVVYVPDAVVDHHVGAERLSADAYRVWYRRFGRSTVLRNPPASFGARARAVGHELRKVRKAARGLRDADPERDALAFAAALRRRAKAEGRLLALLGIGDARGAGAST
jgi:glycosyltransferase involved in cell wall biosynthesis